MLGTQILESRLVVKREIQVRTALTEAPAQRVPMVLLRILVITVTGLLETQILESRLAEPLVRKAQMVQMEKTAHRVKRAQTAKRLSRALIIGQ